jgi:hypothetical protein
MATLEDTIVEQAKTWIGVPYRDKGRDRFGVDCIGVPIMVARELGLSDYDTLDYTKRPDPADFLRGARSQLDVRGRDEIGHGMLAVLREPRHPCHAGIVERDGTGRLWLIHSYAPARMVVREALTEERIRDDLVMVFSFRRRAD